MRIPNFFSLARSISTILSSTEFFSDIFSDIRHRQRELHLHQFRLFHQFGFQPMLLVPGTYCPNNLSN